MNVPLGCTRLEVLPPDARLFVLTVRAWTTLARCRRQQEAGLRKRACEVLKAFLMRAGITAGERLDALLALLGRHAERPVWLGCPTCGAISAGEKRLLAACAAAMEGRNDTCRKLLAFWLTEDKLATATQLMLALAVALVEADIRLQEKIAARSMPLLAILTIIENAPQIVRRRVAPTRRLGLRMEA